MNLFTFLQILTEILLPTARSGSPYLPELLLVDSGPAFSPDVCQLTLIRLLLSVVPSLQVGL